MKYVAYWPSLLLSIILLWSVALPVGAQHHQSSQSDARVRLYQTQAAGVARRYAAVLDSMRTLYASWHYTGADTLANPYYISLFGQPSLHSHVLQRCYAVGTGREAGQPSCGSMSEHADNLVQWSDALLSSIYARQPWLVPAQEAGSGLLDVSDKIKEGVKAQEKLADKYQNEAAPVPQEPVITDEDLAVEVRKPNFWTFSTNFSLQFTQCYISDNWYQGGESNYSLLGSTTINANYNNQRKFIFNNCLEMRLGFQTSQNDDEHKFLTNSDLLRLTNKLGLRATKHWYYTMTLQSWTQFYKGYKKNDPKVYSDFMSPFESLLSLGMDYEAKLKRFQISASLSPIAVKFKSVSRKGLATSFGINEGHRTDWSYGSNITVKYSWQIAKNIKYDARIYFFSDYSKTQIEWENTINLSINKYLSTKLFFYPRFDDARQRKEGESYFQFKELLSLGLNMNF